MIPIKQLPYGKYNTFRSSNHRQIAERKLLLSAKSLKKKKKLGLIP